MAFLSAHLARPARRRLARTPRHHRPRRRRSHPEPRPGVLLEPPRRAQRRHLQLEPRLLGGEVLLSDPQLIEAIARAGDARVRPNVKDAYRCQQRDEQRAAEHDEDGRAWRGPDHRMRSTARRRALRARGFWPTSSSLACTAFVVTFSND